MGGRKGGRRERGGGQRPENRYELRSPAFSLSVGMVGRARHTGTAAAGAREGTSFKACTACSGHRAEAQNPVLGLPGLRNLGERGNFLPLVLGFGFGKLLSERPILPLESAGSPGGGSPGLAWPPGLGKRDPAAVEESEALGQMDGGLSGPSTAEKFNQGGKSC